LGTCGGYDSQEGRMSEDTAILRGRDLLMAEAVAASDEQKGDTIFINSKDSEMIVLCYGHEVKYIPSLLLALLSTLFTPPPFLLYTSNSFP
jgi:hypothetical protein